VSGYTDISVGGLTVNDRFISRTACTLPYLEYAVQRYVPCAKCANPWTALLRLYTLDALICVLYTPLLIIMFMHHIAIRVNKYHHRESHRYMIFQSFFFYISFYGFCCASTRVVKSIRIIFSNFR